MKFTCAFSALSALFLLFSCSAGEDADAVVLSVRTPEVSGSAGQVFVSVISEAEWVLDTDASWARFEPGDEHGTGSCSSVRLNYDANDADTLARVLTITAYVNGRAKATAILGQRVKGREVVEDYSKDYCKSYTTDTWLELPKTYASDGYRIISHKMRVGGKVERNFTYCYDEKHKLARWVAYPLNGGLIGTGDRSNAWGMENTDFIPANCQPILGSGFYSSDGNRYDRGHQIPSADRLVYEANAQTFYYTNMTPQESRFNQGIWSSLEGKVRGWARSCDTLFVVTGCIPEGSSRYAYDNNGSKVTVPSAYFKACVCLFSDSTVGYGGCFGMAICLDHNSNKYESVGRELSCSIDKLESRLGCDLFCNLPDRVGAENAARIEAENPENVSWWW